nr:hypothetical protein 4 [Candidatus Aminicenantes bacterium]
MGALRSVLKIEGDDREFQISRIKLQLNFSAAPLILLKFKSEDFSKVDLRKKIWSRGISKLSIGRGTELEISIISFRDSKKEGFEAVGLILDQEISDWMQKRPLDDRNEKWFIYQRLYNRKADEFIEEFFDVKLAINGDSTLMEKALPDYVCLWRNGSSTNIQTLNYLTDFLSARVPYIWGWFVINDKKAPLRLVTGIKEPVLLNNDWTQVNMKRSHTLLNNDILDDEMILHLNLECKNIGAFFKNISESGSQNDVGKFSSYFEEGSDQIVLTPGSVKYEGQLMNCTEISYSWSTEYDKEDEEKDEIEIRLKLKDIDESENKFSQASLLIDGLFQKWHTQSDGKSTIVEITPSVEKLWTMVTKNGKPDPTQPLWARVAMPGRSDLTDDLKMKGLYILHEKNDPMAITLQEGVTPMILGGIQTYQSELEKIKVNLKGEKVDVEAIEKVKAKAKHIDIPFDEDLKMGEDGKVFTTTHDETKMLESTIKVDKKEKVSILNPGAVIKKDNVKLVGKVEVE